MKLIKTTIITSLLLSLTACGSSNGGSDSPDAPLDSNADYPISYNDDLVYDYDQFPATWKLQFNINGKEFYNRFYSSKKPTTASHFSGGDKVVIDMFALIRSKTNSVPQDDSVTYKGKSSKGISQTLNLANGKISKVKITTDMGDQILEQRCYVYDFNSGSSSVLSPIKGNICFHQGVGVTDFNMGTFSISYGGVVNAVSVNKFSWSIDTGAL